MVPTRTPRRRATTSGADCSPSLRRANDQCLCQQADSLLASPFGLAIEGIVPLKLAEKLCDPPLFPAGDELLKGTRASGFFGWLSAHAKVTIKQVLVES